MLPAKASPLGGFAWAIPTSNSEVNEWAPIWEVQWSLRFRLDAPQRAEKPRDMAVFGAKSGYPLCMESSTFLASYCVGAVARERRGRSKVGGKGSHHRVGLPDGGLGPGK